MNWHVLNEEKPSKNGMYLVTIVTTDGVLVVRSAEYSKDDKVVYWEIGSYYHTEIEGTIIAWAELPEPYYHIRAN